MLLFRKKDILPDMKRSFLWCLAALTVFAAYSRAQTVQQLVEKVKSEDRPGEGLYGHGADEDQRVFFKSSGINGDLFPETGSAEDQKREGEYPLRRVAL